VFIIFTPAKHGHSGCVTEESMDDRWFFLPQSGFVQQVIKAGQKRVGFCPFVAYFNQLFLAS
jgi:hypothetical protein